ncbi:DUF6596 domain-containing protein [Agaribacterium sp. ZY112]|uniref:DUF6596 domain-containing protein n=1 Tax=Agaribacterium sp. ZY112 TaxID=3233574 RepID=UPI003524D2B1
MIPNAAPNQFELETALQQQLPYALALLLRNGMKLSMAQSCLSRAKRSAREYYRKGLEADDLLFYLLFCVDSMQTTSERKYCALASEELGNTPLLQLMLFCHEPLLSERQRLIACLHFCFALERKYIIKQLGIERSLLASEIKIIRKLLDKRNLKALPKHIGTVSLYKLQVLLRTIFQKNSEIGLHQHHIRLGISKQCICFAQSLYYHHEDCDRSAALLSLLLGRSARDKALYNKRDELVELADQDRALWDRSAITLADHYLGLALRTGNTGSYHLEASIEALYNQSPNDDETDWSQLLVLYNALCVKNNNVDNQLQRIYILWRATLNPLVAFEQLERLLEESPELEHKGQYHIRKAQLLNAMSDIHSAQSELKTALDLSISSAERRLLIRSINSSR